MCNQSSGAWIRRSRLVLCVVALLATTSAACGRDSSPLAPSPAPDPTTPPPTTATPSAVSGTVTSKDDAAALAGARLEIVEGANAGMAATTDAAGRYLIGDLPSGAYSIRATLSGFHASANTFTLNGDRAIDFQLARSTGGGQAPDDPPPADAWRLAGVASEAGTRAPVAGAQVEVVEGTNRGRTATSDAQGRYELGDLDAGRFTIRVVASGYAPKSTSVLLECDTELEVALQRDAPPAPTGPSVSGRTVDALSDRPLAGVTVAVDGGARATTNDDGAFTVTGAAGGTQRVTLSSDATVERQTQIRLPADAPTLTLIPRGIDLHAFDEMLRSRGELHRWVQTPRLVVERRVLTFTNTTDMTYVATAEMMSETDASELVADLTWALAQLTGQTFMGFAGVDVETTAEGEPVSISRPGAIVVARFEGLDAAISAWGYGRWAWNGAGEVQAGALMLDRSFDQSGSPYRRSLRAHELGHTLGYDHVSAGISVMNISGRIEPTPFDLDATKIAFGRRPLNMSPDIDPDPVTVNRRTSARSSVRWEGAK